MTLAVSFVIGTAFAILLKIFFTGQMIGLYRAAGTHVPDKVWSIDKYDILLSVVIAITLAISLVDTGTRLSAIPFTLSSIAYVSKIHRKFVKNETQ